MKTLDVLAVGDIHMNNRLPMARPTQNGKTDRLEDQLRMWDQLEEYAAAHDIMTTLILGDLFDKKLLDAVTLTETVRAVARGTQKHILPGNHDANSLRGGRFTVEVFKSLPPYHVMVHDQPKRFNAPAAVGGAEWLDFWPMPYMPIEETRTALLEMGLNRKPDKVNVLLFHNSIMKCEHLGWVCDDGIEPEAVCDGFNWVLSGHFHTHQKFGPNDVGMYLGAPMQHGYADVGEKRGFWHLTFREDGTRTAKLIPVDAPEFWVAESMEEVPERLLDVKRGDFLRIFIRATHPDWVVQKPRMETLVHQLQADGINAEYKHRPIYHHQQRIVTSGGAEQKVTIDEIVSTYVDGDGVMTGDLDKSRLKQLGREALQAIRQG